MADTLELIVAHSNHEQTYLDVKEKGWSGQCKYVYVTIMTSYSCLISLFDGQGHVDGRTDHANVDPDG